MEPANSSTTSGFILLGVSSRPERQGPLFALFLAMYLASALGNATILAAIHMNNHLLHAPMYFFLNHLSLVDLGLTSAVVPKLLAGTLTGDWGISYAGCLAQMYFFIAFGITDSFLLAAMALDRYMAVCHPLRYAIIMSPRFCWALVTSSWLVAHLHSLLHTLLMSRLSFCATRHVACFFCDVFPLLKLSCSNARLNVLVVHTEGAMVVNGALLFILLSYTRIAAAVLKVPSAAGKRKAFSTCGAHLTVVGLFYGTIIWVYFQPSASFSAEKDLLAAIMYTMVTPMLNPFIYTLRNDEMKGTLRRALGQVRATHGA
ncbi:olfactory receptor 1L6 [Alligator mississippiensis]|nr:olfactory receptor 1L6 [Alligator mississippiensis]